jgi:RNA polymerase sigma factor (sigma-70 family)
MASVTTEAGPRDGSEPAGVEGPGDEGLLDRFLTGDARAAGAAFRELLARHGPMVLGVCRHVLDGRHDAEDAFQATFLVLARSAGAIRDRKALARWLYEVAYRTSVRAGARAARRPTREKEAAEMSASTHRHENDPAWNELRPVLHEEVNRLPEKYRSPVVLCYLEGRTNEEAAALLQWPVGTVKGRLARARELLHARLSRRGLTLSAAFLLARLSQNMVFAEIVPSGLAETTARRAVGLARGGAGDAAFPPAVRELAEAEPAYQAVPPPRGLPAVALRIVVGAAVLVATFAVLTYPQDVASGIVAAARGLGVLPGQTGAGEACEGTH